MTLIQLIAACAPLVHPQTMLHVIQAESSGNQWAININGGPTVSAEGQHAIDLAKRYIASGYTVDMGLAQINSRNLPSLGLSVEQVFDPCANITAGATILRENYYRVEGEALPVDTKLNQALSYYNTGDPTAGQKNGYVARVRGADISRYDVPALSVEDRGSATVAEPMPREKWDIFGDLQPKGRWLTEKEEKNTPENQPLADDESGQMDAVQKRSASKEDARPWVVQADNASRTQ